MREAAVASAQGRRRHMEDTAHVEPYFTGREDSLYAGVFDGHGGEAVSRKAAEQLHGLLAAEIVAGRSLPSAIPRAFQTFDDSVRAEPSGSTAAIAVLVGGDLTVGNAGDSHVALVSRGGVSLLTTNHRLTNETEYRRVVAAGATVRGRYACLADGSGLECTRSLGDRGFRRIGILAEPQVATRLLAGEDDWIVAATDGVWDALEVEEVGRLVRDASTAGLAAEKTRDAALATGDDNVTVVAVRL